MYGVMGSLQSQPLAPSLCKPCHCPSTLVPCTAHCSPRPMAANTTKTKVMLITTWQNSASLPENMRTLHVRMNRQYLENVSTDKLLGVKINHNLSWEEHINSIVRKVNSKLALLRGIKGCLPLETHRMFTGAHILSHMDYCFIGRLASCAQSTTCTEASHLNHSGGKGKAIKAPENRSHILLSKLGWINIQNHINFRKAAMIFKSLNNLAPQYMTNIFNYVSNTVNTRQLTTSYNRKDLQIPTGTHKVIYVNSFAYSSVKVWNSILPDVRNCNSLSSFKAGYFKLHFNGF